ncbi:hypothetical protein SAMN05428966_102414 [Massilia sp. PDC64]|nr:hypothetical protein [Massilia sp. PDC64]SDC82139.1 hypothetical protein SAMN05428966_102414 [Massilia sp. PDC64]
MTTETLTPPSLAPTARGPHGVLQAARASLQWRLLLWWAVLLLLPTVVAALPVWELLSASLDHSVYAARLAERLDMIAYADILHAARERYAPALGAGSLVALVLTLLLSPLLAGMALAAARAPQPLASGALLAAGAQCYPRMARMLAWSIVPLGVAGLVGSSAHHLAGQVAETAVLETDAERASHLATLATVVLLLLAHATVDIGRAMLAADRRRTSAIGAWWRGCGQLVRRPLALLGTYLGITAAGLVVAALLAFARVHVPALGTAGTAGAVVLAQLVVLVLGWMRMARLFALTALLR